MSNSTSGNARGGRGEKTRREHEIERIKAQAEAKAAQYHAVALKLEAELQREKGSRSQQRPAIAADPGAHSVAVSAAWEPIDPENEEERPAPSWHDASSWLASTVFHLVLILVLAALSLTVADDSVSPVLTAMVDGQEAWELEDVRFEELVDETALDQSPALPVRLEDPGTAALGEVSGTLSAADVSEAGRLAFSDGMGQIGALFGRDGKGYASAGDGTGGATFFGVKAGGNRFVFVVDASTSMKSNGWEACRRELVAAVGRLKPHQSFYVIFFNYKPHPMFSDEDPEPKPLRATPENLARLRKWVDSFRLYSGTRPMEAMKTALQMRPDAVYFLTDGRLQDDTEDYLKKNNKRKDAYDNLVRAAAVQTIGFYSQDGREVLQRIAKDNGGTFRYVRRP